MTHFAHGGRPGPILSTPGLRAELRRVGPFLCVGLVGFAVDAAIFSGLHGAGLSRPVARALSLALATAVTFGLNRSFTFAPGERRAAGEGSLYEHPPRHRTTGRQWPGRARDGRSCSGDLLRYGIVTLLAQGFSYGLFLVLATRLPNLVALFAAAAAATMFSFAGQRLFTFRDTASERPAGLATVFLLDRPGRLQAGVTAFDPKLERCRRGRHRSIQP